MGGTRSRASGTDATSRRFPFLTSFLHSTLDLAMTTRATVPAFLSASRIRRLVLAVCLFAAAPHAWSQVRGVEVARNGDTYVVTVQAFAPVNRAIAWDVLTDFTHMAAWVPNLRESTVVKPGDRQMTIEQARYCEVRRCRFFVHECARDRPRCADHDSIHAGQGQHAKAGIADELEHRRRRDPTAISARTRTEFARLRCAVAGSAQAGDRRAVHGDHRGNDEANEIGFGPRRCGWTGLRCPWRGRSRWPPF